MSLDTDLKALARRLYLSCHQDGILDLLIGWMAYAFGLRLLFDAPSIALLAGLPDYLLFIILDLVSILVGPILLVRFMHKYPPALEGMDHGPA